MLRGIRNLIIAVGAGAGAIAIMLSATSRSNVSSAIGPASPATASLSSSGPSGNLLINPDFENGYTLYPGHNNIQVPVGWNMRWYTDVPAGHPITYPFKQPEVHVIDIAVWPFCCADNIPPRIHTGAHAIEAGTRFAPQDVAWYQSVGPIPIGAVVTASAWLHAWTSSCNPFPTGGPPLPAVSLQGHNGDGCPDNFWPENTNHMMVGIDPFGGTDPRASSIIWNWAETNPPWWGPYDDYSSTVPAVAVARAHTVTMFMRGVTVEPARYDSFYLDAASLGYSFPISVSAEQDQLWPLPIILTFTVQSPVSLTQVSVEVVDPKGASVPIAFVDTQMIDSMYRSCWRVNPLTPGDHTFTLTAFELTGSVIQTIDVQSLRTDYVQDRLLPRDGMTATEPTLITFTLHSPFSLTNVTSILTDPIGLPATMTFLSTAYITPEYHFNWLFTPTIAGLHTIEISASEFTQLLIRSIIAATDRLHLPIALRHVNE